MAIAPNSTIYLCNVPIDISYKHQINFGNRNAQQTYFMNKVGKTFANYLTVRKTLPNGGLQSSVRVAENIDNLYGYNYMFYQNANHGQRFFYAFIVNLIYVNEGTTEIVFETDVFQTWFLDCKFLPSFVEREHVLSDGWGYNIVPEKFSYDDYCYEEVDLGFTNENNEWEEMDFSYGYLIGCSTFVEVEGDEAVFKGTLQSGIYQGLYFYYFPDGQGVQDFLNIAETMEDCIQFVTCIPKFCVKDARFSEGLTYGVLRTTSSPRKQQVGLKKNGQGVDSLKYGGYKPRNKKLYSSPFCNIVVTNNSGDEAIYNFEDFILSNYIYFNIYADISASPSMTLIPLDYKGADEYIAQGISISNFPQCSTVTDSFKLWLAKNQSSVALQIASGAAQTVMGVGLSLGVPGLGSVVGGSSVAGGISTILNAVNGVYMASKEPNRSASGSPKNNLLTAMKRNKFEVYIRTLKPEYARIVDEFFDMYGYQTNIVKIPNLNSRPYYNYVKTVDANIQGEELGVPHSDMSTLKSIFNNGVTLWKPTATIGDYSVVNNV